MELGDNDFVAVVVEEYPFAFLFAVDEVAHFLGFAGGVESLVEAVVGAIFPVAADLDFAVGEIAGFLAILFVVEVVDDVAWAVVVVVGFPFAIFHAVAEVACVIRFAGFVVGCPNAVFFAFLVGAFVEFLAFFVPGCPGAFSVAVDVFAFSPFLAGFVVVGPGAVFVAVGVGAFDAEFSGGAPIVEPFAFFLAVFESAFHVEVAVGCPPGCEAFEFVVFIGSFELELAVFVPFFGGAFAAAVDKVDFVFLLSVVEPGFVGAVFLAIGDFYFALEVAVLEPGAGESVVGVAFFGAAGAVFVVDFPDAGFFAFAVVSALLIDSSVGVPPGPVADADAVVVHHAFDCDLGVAVVEFLVFDLGLCLHGEQCGCQKEKDVLIHWDRCLIVG